MDTQLSPLMQRQVDRAREAGLRVEVTGTPTSTRVVIREGGPWAGWLMVTVVPSAGSRWAHYASRNMSPGTRPKELPVRRIAGVVNQYVEDEKHRRNKD